MPGCEAALVEVARVPFFVTSTPGSILTGHEMNDVIMTQLNRLIGSINDPPHQQTTHKA